MLRAIIVYSTLIFLLMTPALHAAEKAVAPAKETVESSDAKRAQALLARAVDYYKGNKDRALAAFSRAGEFINGDLYVYVVGTNGQMLASGGSSSALIGRDISDLRDATGKAFIREMIDTAKTKGAGTVEYRWLNRSDRKIERKVVNYQKVDDRIIAVGFYIARASQEQAKTLLDQAANAITIDSAAAYTLFNDLNGKFIQDDLYVFVIDLKDSKFRAHGATPRLVGTDALDLKDPTGMPLLKKMIANAKTSGYGTLEYHWRNPVTEKVEKKTTFLRKVNNVIVGVGYYTR
jgi:cytochrome c